MTNDLPTLGSFGKAGEGRRKFEIRSSKFETNSKFELRARSAWLFRVNDSFVIRHSELGKGAVSPHALKSSWIHNSEEPVCPCNVHVTTTICFLFGYWSLDLL